jgi:uncharacterized protein
VKLETKLADMQRHLGVATVPPSAVSSPRLGRSIDELLRNQLREDASGSCVVAENVRGADERHGLYAFRDLRHLTGSQFALISRDPELAYVDVSRAVFLDTETTGLSTGAGTYVFLVGAGFVDGDVFRVRQFFLRGPGVEREFLTELATFLNRFSCVVTFNGKAFDLPLLESRFVRHRARMPIDNSPHVDLLHPARTLWKRRLDSCALTALESHLLGVARSREDVPGYEIPSRYFRYQRTGDAEPLEGVFYHNLQDILTLAILALHIDAVVANPSHGQIHEPIDFYSLGRAYDRAGETSPAASCYEEALALGLAAPHRCECLVRLATLQKRQRWWDSAIQNWYRLIDDGGAGALFGLVEMAKYHEHVEGEYDQAVEAVRAALLLVDLGGHDWTGIDRAGLEHRLSRLLNRHVSGRSRRPF